MFLKEVQTKPPEGMTKIAFQRLEDTGETIPDILHLFRFKRRATDHLVRFTEEVMRGPSPLSPGLRELIGAFFSKHNQCSFCSDAHAAAAAQLLGKDLVEEVLHDLESSRLDAPHKELFRYIGKLAENPARITAADVSKVKKAGWSEEAIYDALTVASVFRFYNTWNNGAGVRTMTSADYHHSGKVLNTLGYCMDFKLSRLLRIGVRKVGDQLRSLFLPRQNRFNNPSRSALHSSPASPAAPLACPIPAFKPVEKSFFKEEVLSVSARDE